MYQSHADMIPSTAGLLWTGHNDGKVCAYTLNKRPGTSIARQMLNSWVAHKIGCVTNILTTPKGELWTGSSRGIIRIWHGGHKMGGGKSETLLQLCAVIQRAQSEILQINKLDVLWGTLAREHSTGTLRNLCRLRSAQLS